MYDSPRRPLILRLGRRSLTLLDLTGAALYGVLACAVLADRGSAAPALLGGVLVAGPIAVHRKAPMAAYAVLVLTMAVAPISAALGFVALPPLALMLTQLSAQRSVRVSAVLLGAGLAATSLPDFGHNGAAVPFGFVIVAAWAVGVALGQQQRYGRALIAHREALAEQRARDLSAAERLGLARELHDVVAHSMSAVTVQAAYGNLIFATRPDEARAALGAVESTGRQAMTEMRELLGVLREPGFEPAGIAPAVTVRDLDRLVTETARAGVRVDVTTTGEVRPLPAGLDGSVFRIVQEALTNVVRHAHTDTAQVSLGYGPRELTVVISDGGCGSGAGNPSGHGLLGIRERVALHGGTVAAGPGGDGGYQLNARFPLPDPESMTVRVLVAEDQALVRAGLCGIVGTAPDLMIVGEATTGGQAVELATSEHPDVVLMDVRMPGMDGLEATRRITATTAARVLMLTTFDLDDYVYSALRGGASGFLLKDTPPADLLAAIRVVAAGEALLAPSVTARLIARVASTDAPATPPDRRLTTVTDREHEVLLLVAEGLSNAEIAARLGIGTGTAKTHVAHLLTKLDARDRVQLVILAHRWRLV